MPAPRPIDPEVILALFDYDASSGQLRPKPHATRAVRKTDRNQWEIGEHRYVLHRLIWAIHNPDNANPYAVQFKDGDRTNTRIENLTAIKTNPRWIGHKKIRRARLNDDGMLIYEDLVNAALEAQYHR